MHRQAQCGDMACWARGTAIPSIYSPTPPPFSLPLPCNWPTRLQVAVGSCPTSPHPRAMLVCGADVVLSMADPKAWRQDLLEVSHGMSH